MDGNREDASFDGGHFNHGFFGFFWQSKDGINPNFYFIGKQFGIPSTLYLN